MYNRILNLPELLKKKSIFLFGPRATGKSSLIRQQLPGAKIYDLLDSRAFERLLRRPQIIEEENSLSTQALVIDEIQKLPGLLDEVHRLIFERNQLFLLTGSSARKLKRGGANLLAGRAWTANLFPLVSAEIPDFCLNTYLTRGGLPSIYPTSDYWEELRAYVGNYLQEEILAEAAVRNIETFGRFLEVAATKVGEEINYQSVASDCGVSPKTIRNYLEVFEDTLLGFTLEPFRETKKRKAVSRSKFYLFDIGVNNFLLGQRDIAERTDAFGKAFEHFIAKELRAYLSYRRRDEKFTYWRTHSKYEVDCIVGRELAIEVKSTELVREGDLKGIRALREEGLIRNYAVVSRDPEMRVIDGIKIYPWKKFVEELWGDRIFGKVR